MEILQGREQIIAKVEGREFHDIKNCTEGAVSMRGKTIYGEPYIRDEEKGRVFGLLVPEVGEVEIYSHMFNNLTNGFVDFVVLK